MRRVIRSSRRYITSSVAIAVKADAGIALMALTRSVVPDQVWYDS